MKTPARFLEDGLLGVRFAVNVFIGTTALWLLLGLAGDTDPIWAIASMIAASDPQLKQAVRTFRGRILNAILGCAVGLLLLVAGGARAWKLPLALSVSVLLSTYVVRIQVMWRQAPITAAIVIAAGLTHHSKLSGIEHGLHKVAEVILGCVMGLLVSWGMSKVWPVPDAGDAVSAAKT
jgi:uncharacterized membrane protein YccC